MTVFFQKLLRPCECFPRYRPRFTVFRGDLGTDKFTARIAAFIPGESPPLVMIASRILLIPVIASVGYELLRLGARHRSNPVGS